MIEKQNFSFKFPVYLFNAEVKTITILINPQAPVAQKNADEVVFRHFQGE